MQIPMEYARNKQIILNITPHTINNLKLTNNKMRFNAHFNNIPHQISIPLTTILTIYTHKNNTNTIFKPKTTYNKNTNIINNKKTSTNNKTIISIINNNKPNHNNNTHPNNKPPQPPHNNQPTLHIIK